MDNIDNILQDLNIPNPQETVGVETVTAEPIASEPANEETSPTSLSDTDIDEILQDNNFTFSTAPVVNPTASPTEDTSDEENFVVNTDDEFDDSDEDEEEDNEEDEEENNEERVESSNNNVKLPLNSPTLLLDESTTRFSGAEWYKEIQKTRVIVAGIGGIGSNFVFQLARMVPACITMYDNDNVERVNMAGQLFSTDNIGTAKVSAIATMIQSYTSMRQINAIQELFTNNTEPGDIMVCGFDNMSARRVFFNSWKKHVESKPLEKRAKCLYLDGRLSIDTLQILCITGDDSFNIERYSNEFLFLDSEADATICSMKQTTYLACMIGSLMVNLFTNFIANQLNPVIPYDLPFFTEYDAQNMIFKTES